MPGMKFMLTFCIVWLSWITQTKGLYRSCYRTTCANISHQCTPASPNVTYSSFTNTFEVTDIGNNFKESFLWVGYVKTHIAFTYLGCAEKMTLMSQTYFIGSRDGDGPSLCYSVCQTDFIGIDSSPPMKTNNCLCLRDVPGGSLLHNDKCTEPCTYPAGTLCGGKVGNTIYVSVYTKESYPSTVPHALQSNESKLCLAYDKSNSGFYFWTECEKHYKYICQNASGHLLFEPSETGYRTWSTQMNMCFQQNAYPVNSSTDLSNLKSNASQFWTGIVRGFGLAKNMALSCSTSEERTIRQGYLSNVNTHGQYILNFDQQIGEYFVLCLGYNGGCSSSITSSATPQTSKVVTASTKGTVTYSETNIMTTLNSYPNVTETDTLLTSSSADSSSTGDRNMNVTQSRTQNEPKPLVAVYVTVPIVIVVVIVVIGILIWRKRHIVQKKDSLDARHFALYLRQNDVNVVNDCYHNVNPGQVGTPKAERHGYFILEPQSAGYSAIGEFRVDTENDKYDTTGHLKQSRQFNSHDNVYNHLDTVPGDIYDHTNAGSNYKESTYNHIKHYPVSSIYNETHKTNLEPNSKSIHHSNLNGSEEDTYNHLKSVTSGSVIFHTGNEDNPYCHEFVRKPDNDPTYNHIGESMRDGKLVASEHTETSDTLKNFKTDKVAEREISHNYTEVNKSEPQKVGKPGLLTLENIPTNGNYEFAKEPSSRTIYEFAKPPSK